MRKIDKATPHLIWFIIGLVYIFPILKSQYIINIEWIIAASTFAMGLVLWAGDAIINWYREIR